MQITDTILMIRPASFAFNPETAANNYFQNEPVTNAADLQSAALAEFDQAVATLRENGINVLVIDDTTTPAKPDAIFPNNWISTSPDGIISVYPMFAASRRLEKRDDIIHYLRDNFIVNDVMDWSEFEAEEKYLEGTGSMVIDHDDKVIYACYSPRTDINVLEKFADTCGYRAIVFLATDSVGRAIYHTNVVMCVGEEFAVICEEAIEEEWELIAVRQLLETTGHMIIPITRYQMERFAGNMLQVRNRSGHTLIVLSKTALDSLTDDQITKLGSHGKLLPLSVSTIEKVEGGSIRCMIAEVFLEKRN